MDPVEDRLATALARLEGAVDEYGKSLEQLKVRTSGCHSRQWAGRLMPERGSTWREFVAWLAGQFGGDPFTAFHVPPDKRHILSILAQHYKTLFTDHGRPATYRVNPEVLERLKAETTGKEVRT